MLLVVLFPYNTAIAMAIKLSMMINTSAFFSQMLFIHNYRRMTITFYGLDAAGMNSFMGLDQGVSICLSLYNITGVLSPWLSLEADYICLIISQQKNF